MLSTKTKRKVKTKLMIMFSVDMSGGTILLLDDGGNVIFHQPQILYLFVNVLDILVSETPAPYVCFAAMCCLNLLLTIRWEYHFQVVIIYFVVVMNIFPGCCHKDSVCVCVCVCMCFRERERERERGERVLSANHDR